jgi:hypothetical protein
MDTPTPTTTPAIAPQIAAAAAAFRGDPLKKSPEQIAADERRAAEAEAAAYSMQRRTVEVRNQLHQNRMQYISEIAPYAVLGLVVGVVWGGRK